MPLGMLRVREGKPDEARKSLEQAVAANSQNYLIHYYYAFALSREGMDQSRIVSAYTPETAAKMRAELKKAIELRPDYPESYSLLAFINLVSGSQLDESVELLKRALAVSPGRNDLVLMLAQVYMRKEDYKTARQLLEKLSGNTADAEMRQGRLLSWLKLSRLKRSWRAFGPKEMDSEWHHRERSGCNKQKSSGIVILRRSCERHCENRRPVNCRFRECFRALIASRKVSCSSSKWAAGC